MAGYDLTRDELYEVLVPHRDHLAFIDLLRMTRSRFPLSERVYAICDNLSTHLTEEVERFCRANRITLVLTPTYASRLNPIEPHFGPLRYFVIDGSDYTSHEELAEAITDYFLWRNTHRDLKQWLRDRRNAAKAA